MHKQIAELDILIKEADRNLSHALEVFDEQSHVYTDNPTGNTRLDLERAVIVVSGANDVLNRYKRQAKCK